MAEADTSPTHRVQGAETRLEAVKDDVLLQRFAEPFGGDGVHVRGVDLVRGGQEIVAPRAGDCCTPLLPPRVSPTLSRNHTIITIK